MQDQVQVELHGPGPDARASERLDARIAAQRPALHSRHRASRLQLLPVLPPTCAPGSSTTPGGAAKGKGEHRKGGKRGQDGERQRG